MVSKKKINVITDLYDKKIVLIEDIRFRSRRNINWDEIEKLLKEYVGEFYEIVETAEKVYIGTDFPDEFCRSEDRIKTKGGNLKAKANMINALEDLVGIATNKKVFPDYEKKHGNKAKYGWYRYDSRFGLPVYNESGELIRYNIYSARMLVRRDVDGRLYLYDFVKIKKETCSPPR